MRDYDNDRFREILGEIRNKDSVMIATMLSKPEFTPLSFFLTRNFHYAVIVDDYPFPITDKKSLLEALYYQAKLITAHDLNWDAFADGLSDALNNLGELEGMVLLFREGENLNNALPNELKMLSEIANTPRGKKKIRILI